MILIVFFLASDTDITVQTILSYTPESPFAAGYLFHTPAALLINFLGRAITLFMIPLPR